MEHYIKKLIKYCMVTHITIKKNKKAYKNKIINKKEKYS